MSMEPESAESTALHGRPLRSSELRPIARRLFWWLPPEEALGDRRRFLAQVMTLGTWDDVQRVRAEYGEQRLREVLHDAPPGVFDQRSWHYWHNVFGIAPAPPLPHRTIP